MTTTTAIATDLSHADASRWPARLAWAVAALGLACAWFGGPLGLAGAAFGTAAFGIAMARAAHRPQSIARPDEGGSRSVPGAGRQGAAAMVERVVPAWSRQLEMARASAGGGQEQVLATLGEMSCALDTLTGQLGSVTVAAGVGAVDNAVRACDPALARLLAPSQRAFAERDAVLAELSRCADALSDMQQLAKQAREIARHTRLVAFNASIEANRSQQHASDGGAQAVAAEVRVLAERMASTGAGIERIVLALGASSHKARREGELTDTTAEELRLEISLRAREALAALLAGMAASPQGSTIARQASAALRDRLDAALLQLRCGDRVNQRLSIIGNDMGHFARWVAANPQANQGDAAQWLAALEARCAIPAESSTCPTPP